jgi:O-antigen/teichoic acid export membrane protein
MSQLPPGSPDSDSGGPHHGETHTELNYLARSGALAFGGQILSALLAFGFSLAVSHLFRAVGTGAFFEAVAVFTVASYIGAMGADTGLTRMLPYFKVHGRSRDIIPVLPIALGPSLVVTCAMAVALYVWAPDLARIVTHVPTQASGVGSGNHNFTEYMHTLAPFLPLSTLAGVLVAGARGFDSMWPAVSIQNILVPVTRLLLLLTFVLAGWGALAVGLAWAIPLVLGAAGCIMALQLLVKRFGGDDREQAAPTPRRPLAKEFWSYAAPRGVGATFSFIVLWLDIVLVGALASTRQAGIYAVASRYVILATFPMVALGFAIAPQISRLLAAHLIAQTRRVFQAGTAWLVSLAWPACIIMGVFAPILMRLFGTEFIAGGTSLSILSAAMLLNTGAGSCGVVLVMAGRTGINLVIAALGAVIDVGGNFILIPHLGMRGAAIAWAATMVVVNGLTVAYLFRAFALHPFGRATVRVALSSLLCFGLLGVILRAALGASWTALTIAVAVGIPCYLALLWRSRDELGLHAFKALAAGKMAGNASETASRVDELTLIHAPLAPVNGSAFGSDT